MIERHFRTEFFSVAMMIFVFTAAFCIHFKEAIITFFLFCLALVAIGAIALFALINWQIVFWIVIFIAICWIVWKVLIEERVGYELQVSKD